MREILKHAVVSIKLRNCDALQNWTIQENSLG